MHQPFAAWIVVQIIKLCPLVIKIGVKYNYVCMSGHDNKRVDTQILVLLAVVETFGKDEARFS